MRPWIYGAVMLMMVGLPTVVPWVLRRTGRERRERRDGYVGAAVEQRLRRVTPRVESSRGRFLGMTLVVLTLVACCAGMGWVLTQPRRSPSANQMDHGGEGLPAWAAYPLGVTLPLVGMWLTQRDLLAAMFRRGRSRPAKLNVPERDGGWKPSP